MADLDEKMQEVTVEKNDEMVNKLMKSLRRTRVLSFITVIVVAVLAAVILYAVGFAKTAMNQAEDMVAQIKPAMDVIASTDLPGLEKSASEINKTLSSVNWDEVTSTIGGLDIDAINDTLNGIDVKQLETAIENLNAAAESLQKISSVFKVFR